MAIDAKTRQPRIGAGHGGLSGPAIKPIALRMVEQAAKAVKIPVIGIGGIAKGEDAAEFLIAGASLVEVGTATFWDPGAVVRIARELEKTAAGPRGGERARSGRNAEEDEAELRGFVRTKPDTGSPSWSAGTASTCGTSRRGRCGRGC